jgi:hypothetical protein
VDDRPLRVAFVDDGGREVPLQDVRFVRTAAYPPRRSASSAFAGAYNRNGLIHHA